MTDFTKVLNKLIEASNNKTGVYLSNDEVEAILNDYAENAILVMSALDELPGKDFNDLN